MPAGEIPIPALLQGARGSYGRAVHRRLDAAGFDDLPRNGAFVLGGMANHGEALGGLIRRLGISKQATGQLVDTLVTRGYLERRLDPDDRRRMLVEPTERGRAAAAEVRAAVDKIDRKLAARLAPGELGGLRAGLLALAAIREELEA